MGARAVPASRLVLGVGQFCPPAGAGRLVSPTSSGQGAGPSPSGGWEARHPRRTPSPRAPPWASATAGAGRAGLQASWARIWITVASGRVPLEAWRPRPPASPQTRGARKGPAAERRRPPQVPSPTGRPHRPRACSAYGETPCGQCRLASAEVSARLAGCATGKAMAQHPARRGPSCPAQREAGRAAHTGPSHHPHALPSPSWRRGALTPMP